MFKVILKNEKYFQETNGEHGLWDPIVDTREEADAWLAKQIGKPHRMPERLGKDEDGKEITIPADYTVEILDLSKDPVFMDEQINKKRLKEYPSISEVTEALIEAVAEGKSEQLTALQAKRKAIKEKYPKSDEFKSLVSKAKGLL